MPLMTVMILRLMLPLRYDGYRRRYVDRASHAYDIRRARLMQRV